MPKITLAQLCGFVALTAIVAACVLVRFEAIVPAPRHALGALLVIFCNALAAFAVLDRKPRQHRRTVRITNACGTRIQMPDYPARTPSRTMFL